MKKWLYRSLLDLQKTLLPEPRDCEVFAGYMLNSNWLCPCKPKSEWLQVYLGRQPPG